jgi:hypothetical protein
MLRPNSFALPASPQQHPWDPWLAAMLAERRFRIHWQARPRRSRRGLRQGHSAASSRVTVGGACAECFRVREYAGLRQRAGSVRRTAGSVRHWPGVDGGSAIDRKRRLARRVRRPPQTRERHPHTEAEGAGGPDSRHHDHPRADCGCRCDDVHLLARSLAGLIYDRDPFAASRVSRSESPDSLAR